MRKMCAILAIFIVLISMFSVNVGAEPVPRPAITSGNNICVLNLETGDTPMNIDGDVSVGVSATAKMMTALVVYENVSDLSTLVTVPAQAADSLYIGVVGLISTPYLGLTVGDEYSVKNLLSALLISSANDAAVTLAYYVGNGDINAFVNKMNEKAKALGAKNTTYNSCVGLDDGSRTTAYDAALIAAEFAKTGTLLDISSAGKYVMSSSGNALHSKNYLSSDFYVRGYKLPAVKGICAGQLNEDGGYCLLAYYSSNELSYIICIMDASGEKRTNGTRWFEDENAYADVHKIVPWLKESFEIRNIISPDSSEYSFPISVTLSAKVSSIMTVPTETVKVLTDITAEKINYVAESTFFRNYLEAPVKEGEVVGEVNLYKNGVLVATVPLVTKSGTEKSEMLAFMGEVEDFFKSDTARLVIKLIVILAIVFVVWSLACFIFRIIKKYRNGMTKDYYPSSD